MNQTTEAKPQPDPNWRSPLEVRVQVHDQPYGCVVRERVGVLISAEFSMFNGTQGAWMRPSHATIMFHDAGTVRVDLHDKGRDVTGFYELSPDELSRVEAALLSAPAVAPGSSRFAPEAAQA